MIGLKSALSVAASATSGLGSIACGQLSPEQVAREVASLRAVALRPFNPKFFCQSPTRGVINRLMRELGPFHTTAQSFPWAGFPSRPLRQAAEARGQGDFSPLWAGQGFGLSNAQPAAEVTQKLAEGVRI